MIPTTLTILKDLKKKHKISVDFISHEGMQTLTNYDWPGNVRELENTLERILLIHDKPIIESEDINNILEDSTRVGSFREESATKEPTQAESAEDKTDEDEDDKDQDKDKENPEESKSEEESKK